MNLVANSSAARSWSFCAPPSGSAIMPSMMPRRIRSGAVNFNAAAACSAFPLSR